MRDSQIGGTYRYVRLSRGQVVQALLPLAFTNLTVQVTGDEGVLTPLRQEPAARGGVLLRYVVADEGSVRIDAIGTSGGAKFHYVDGVVAVC
jgi:hypothetical protein